jgi:hypothetical protein
MRRIEIGLTLVLVAGCRQIFGLDDPKPPHDAMADAMLDAPHDAHTDAGVCSTAGLTCTAPVAKRCGNNCWVSCPDPVTQATASSRCVAWGGKLAPLRTSGDQTCLRQTVVPTGDVWIGFEQDATATTPAMGWSWNGDGITPTFLNWTTGQPDDGDGVEDHTEQCAMIAAGVSTWSDTVCTATLPWACSVFFDD